MNAYMVANVKWIFKHAPQLTGKAQRYDNTEETYIANKYQRTAETHRELPIQLCDLANKWLKDILIVKQIKHAIVLEQFLTCLSSQIRVWINLGEDTKVRILSGRWSVGR